MNVTFTANQPFTTRITVIVTIPSDLLFLIESKHIDLAYVRYFPWNLITSLFDSVRTCL